MPNVRGAKIDPIPLPNQGFFGAGRALIADVTNSAWFTPGIPVQPQAPADTLPRRFDYPTGININYVPRAEEQVTMEQLRNMAEYWDLLRLVMETRKDQIAGIPFVIRPRKNANETAEQYKKRIKGDPLSIRATEFFRRPDGDHLWQTWIRILMEEMFVLDALTLYPFKGKDGSWFVDILDGGTIKRLLDAQGRTPQPPDMAYEQVIKGMPSHGFTTQQLLYRPRNQRAWKLYGFGPVEQVLWTVNLAMRRQMWKLNYYLSGNIPEAIVQMPDTWPPDRIKQFQEWWNAMLSGQLDTRRQVLFVPGFGGANAISYPKQDIIKDEMDEWLARVICFCFSVSPQPFIREGTSRANLAVQQQMSKAEGLMPTLSWMSEVLTDLMENSFGWKGLEFVFQEEEEPDLLKRAQIQEIRARNGISMIDEIREENGDEAIGVGAGIITGTGFQAFDGQLGTPEPPPGMGPGGPGSPGGNGGRGFQPDPGDAPGDTGVQPRSGPTVGPEIVKRHAGGGRLAFASDAARYRVAHLEQLLATYLAQQRERAKRQLVPEYGRHTPSRKTQPPLESSEQPVVIVVHDGDGHVSDGDGNGNGYHPLEKATTTGITQATGVKNFDLEGGKLTPTMQAATVAAAVVAAMKQMQPDLHLDRDRLHLDLAAAMKEAFRDLPRPEPPPTPDVTVNVTPAPPPPVTIEPSEVHVHLPEKTVHVDAGAIQVHTPPPPEVKVSVQAAKAPDVTVQAPPAPPPAQVTIINKQKRPKVKVQTNIEAKITPGKRTTKIIRDDAGQIDRTVTEHEGEEPKKKP